MLLWSVMYFLLDHNLYLTFKMAIGSKMGYWDLNLVIRLEAYEGIKVGSEENQHGLI